MTAAQNSVSTGAPDDVLVTFDLFSALIDSRTGGSAFFERLAGRRGWPTAGSEVYDDWDGRNKLSQLRTDGWISFAEHSRRALADSYGELGLDGDVETDVVALLADVANWPLWPDVTDGLLALSRRCTVGVLSNVDDDVYRRTRVAALIDDAAVLTSERLRAYKPRPEIYLRAADRAGDRVFVHVASSARDVRGALEAGLTVFRLGRPGHTVDPQGPTPRVEIRAVAEVANRLEDRPNSV